MSYLRGILEAESSANGEHLAEAIRRTSQAFREMNIQPPPVVLDVDLTRKALRYAKRFPASWIDAPVIYGVPLVLNMEDDVVTISDEKPPAD